MRDNMKQGDSSSQDNKAWGFFSMSPEQFTALATLLGFLLAEELNLDEQNSLGNFFMSIGQTLATYAAQASLLQSNQDSQQLTDRLMLLKCQLNDIEQELERRGRA